MTPKPKMTKQGIRDLNNYGPKAAKASVEAQPVANEGDAPDTRSTAPEKPDAPPAE